MSGSKHMGGRCRVRTTGEWQDLDKEMREYEPSFFLHHDLWKWQEDDIQHLKCDFPRGTFWSVQDFSENGDLHPRLEQPLHQSTHQSSTNHPPTGRSTVSSFAVLRRKTRRFP